jgi:hypothetical protein
MRTLRIKKLFQMNTDETKKEYKIAKTTKGYNLIHKKTKKKIGSFVKENNEWYWGQEPEIKISKKTTEIIDYAMTILYIDDKMINHKLAW